MFIAVATSLCTLLVLIITIQIVIWCNKRLTCKCTYKRRTTEGHVPITQNVVEMQTCLNKVWDSDIVTEIGDLGICPTRLVVEKDIGEGQLIKRPT